MVVCGRVSVRLRMDYFFFNGVDWYRNPRPKDPVASANGPRSRVLSRIPRILPSKQGTSISKFDLGNGNETFGQPFLEFVRFTF